MYYYYRILHFVLMNLKCMGVKKGEKALYGQERRCVVGCVGLRGGGGDGEGKGGSEGE